MFLDNCFRVLTGFDHRKLIDGLSVIRYRTETINGDGHRAHAQETESDQTESENRSSKNEFGRQYRDDGRIFRYQIGYKH